MANVSINNITETWSSSGTTYTGIKYNVTDNGSATGSNLMDLQVGGVSKFSVGKDGTLRAVGTGMRQGFTFGNDTFLHDGGAGQLLISSGNNYRASIGINVTLQSSGTFAWGNAASSGATLGTTDLVLARDQANTLAQRNGINNPQSYRLYLSYTDATNNSRFAINTTANYYRLASEIGTSTGSKKPIVTDIYQSAVDPTTTDIPDGTSTVWKNTTSGVVKLWANNGGTLIGVALA